MTAFSKISKLVMISMGRAGYTYCSVGGGGYKTVFRGKGAVWLQNRFEKYGACFLHPLFYCCNSEDNTEDKQQKVDLGPKNSFVKMITLYQKHFRINKKKSNKIFELNHIRTFYCFMYHLSDFILLFFYG